MRFLDTNVLLYAACPGPKEADKQRIAVALLGSTDLCLSVQVLQEFYAQATRPTRPGAVGHELGVRLIRTWLRFPVQDLSTDILLAALDIKARYQLSYWDAAIVAAAAAMGSTELLTEDLDTGAVIAGVRVVNPFAGGNAPPTTPP